MPNLEWMGKDKVIDHYRKVPYRVLKKIDSKSVEASDGTDHGNKVIQGDNLESLKSLLPEYEARVDCIYIDPPYNTGNEDWVYNDNVNDPRFRRWLGKAVGKEGEDFSRHDKWLCMMYPRLQLLRLMLSNTGAIFISIDDNEEASLKTVCDEIFGTSCFVSNIAWQRTYSARNDSKGIVNEVEHILVYSRFPGWKPNKLERTAEMNTGYGNPDNDTSPWTSSDTFAPGAATHPGMVYAIQHPFTGELLYPPSSRHWCYQQDTILDIMNGWCGYELRDIDDAAKRAEICGLATDEIRTDVYALMLTDPLEESRRHALAILGRGQWPRFFFTQGGQGGIRRKTYLDSVGGRLVTNLWPYKEVGHTDEASKEIKAMFDGNAVFSTPKPTRLIRRIIDVATSKDSIILDAFAGSGTTAQAVLEANAADGGNRRFVLAEMSDYADSITAERARKIIRGFTTTSKITRTVYEKKLTAANIRRAAQYLTEANAAREEALSQGDYSAVSKPKIVDNALTVVAETTKGETVPGLDSGFSYYEMGPVLFNPDGMLNPDVPREDLFRYVWYTETKADYTDLTDQHPYLLGELTDTVYYLAYEGTVPTVLGEDLLSRLPRRTTTTVIYADRCVLSPERRDALNIVFKQIPRQIARM